MKPSTLSFIRESRRTQGHSFLDWMHGYIYGRWPYLYIGIGRGLHPLNRIFGPPLRWLACLLRPGLRHKNTLAEGYHGKVMLPEGAVQMISVNEDVRITDLEKVVP